MGRRNGRSTGAALITPQHATCNVVGLIFLLGEIKKDTVQTNAPCYISVQCNVMGSTPSVAAQVIKLHKSNMHGYWLPFCTILIGYRLPFTPTAKKNTWPSHPSFICLPKFPCSWAISRGANIFANISN